LKEQIMETMQCAIHCCIQLHIVAATKSMFHPIVNPEVTLLSAVRFLLLAVSIILEAVSYMKSEELIDEPDGGLTDLQPDEVKAAVVYVLHYGRPLFKGEGQEQPEPEEEVVKPVIHGNIMYPNGLPPDLHLKEGEVVGDEYPPDEDIQPATDSVEDDSAEQKPAAKSIQPVAEAKPVEKPVERPVDKPVAKHVEAPKPVAKHVEAPKPAEPAKVDPPKPDPPKPDPPKPDPPKPVETPKPQASEQNLNWADPLQLPKDVVLKLTPDLYNEQNLPPNFEKAPGSGQKPVAPKQGSVTEDEYKQWMKDKYEYEQWENKLILWKIKLKRRIAEFS